MDGRLGISAILCSSEALTAYEIMRNGKHVHDTTGHGYGLSAINEVAAASLSFRNLPCGVRNDDLDWGSNKDSKNTSHTPVLDGRIVPSHCDALICTDAYHYTVH